MTYNILEGGTGRIDPLAEVIRLAGADAAIVQEASDEALFHKLADRLGMDRFLAANPRDAKGAVGLLTRLRIREAINLAAVDGRLTRSALAARLESVDGGALEVIGLHLHAREADADEAQRLAELPAIFDAAARLGAAHCLAGDFNASHPDQVIDLAKARASTRQRAAAQGGVLPRAAIAAVLARGYVDAHAVGRPPADFDTSFTTAYPALRVDYIFASAAMAPRVKSCIVFKPEMARFASDHFPVVAEIAAA